MDRLYDKLKELGFSFSDKPSSGSLYLMPDGMFLSLDENRDILGVGVLDTKIVHGHLDNYLMDLGLVDDDGLVSRVLCESDNAVRLNDGTLFKHEVFIGLPRYKLTAAQIESLIDWLYYIMSKSAGVAIGDELGAVGKYYEFVSVNGDGYTPEQLIGKISAYYNNGILKERYLLDKYKRKND